MVGAKERGRVLIVAGSDSGGGAGIQADIKTVTALGGFAMTAITALTAQNTRGVFGVHGIPTDFIARQMELVLDDIGADTIKTGMLHSADVIETVARVLKQAAPDVPVVVDPVMIAASGDPLLEAEAVKAVRDTMVPLAHVLTPNVPEAEALTGATIDGVEAMVRAGETLRGLGAAAVLVKGGHMSGDQLVDVLVTEAGAEQFLGTRIETPHTHGTGCTLASAIACGLGQGLDLRSAVARGRSYLRWAIKLAPGFGGGHGPVQHGHTVMPFQG